MVTLYLVQNQLYDIANQFFSPFIKYIKLWQNQESKEFTSIQEGHIVSHNKKE